MAVDLDELMRLYTRSRTELSNWLTLWQEIADYMVPWRNSIITQVTPGTKLTQKIFDSTAPQALITASSAVHGAVTPSTLRWFSFTIDQKELLDEEGVAPWLDDTAEAVWQVISASNFDSEAQELYSDILAFGIACMTVEERDAVSGQKFAGIRNHTQQPGTFSVSEGPDGTVDTVYREIPMTVGALARRWGIDKISEASQKLLEAKKSDQIVTVLHAIYPRTEWSPSSQVGSKRPFASIWLETGSSLYVRDTAPGKLHLLREDGRFEMPAMTPRWRKMSGESIGRGPGSVILPDVRTLNQAVELRLKAWTLAIAPPIVTPDRGVIGHVRLEPFGRTYTRGGAKIELLDVPARFDVANFSEEQLRTVIKAGFFVDLLNFQGKDGTPISATEASIKFQSMQRILGPVVSRLQSEFLAPYVTTVLQMMARRGALPAPPPVLANANLELRFEGPLSRVQRATDLEAIQQFLGVVFPIAQAEKRVLDRINFDEVVETLQSATSTPARILRSRASADAMAAAEAQQAQAQQMQQSMLEAAQAFKQGGNQNARPAA